MIRRYLILVLAFALLLSSCVHHTPFEDEYYFQALGDSSELVVTADVNKMENSSLSEVLPTEGLWKTIVDRADRVNVCMTPMTLDKYPLDLSDYSISGGIEGNFGSFTVNTALSWSKQFHKEKIDDVKFYTDGNLSVAVPKSGLLLFTDAEYIDLYRKTYSERVKLIEDEIANDMASSTAAVFVRTPQTLMNLGFELPDTTLKQIHTSYFMINEVDDQLLLSGYMIMLDKSGARTMNTILRNQIIQSLKRSGQKVDVKALAGYFNYDGNVVTISSFPLEGEMKEKALTLISDSLKGLM